MQVFMVEVTIRLPENVAQSFGANPEAVARQILENAAAEGYRAGRLSHRQVGEMLRLDYWQTEKFLVERQVPLNYTIADLQADQTALENVLAK
jgi:predicted HTH domain antitoxin